ncbi:helix-turn-helix domain-containing protein [Rhodanobacter sp. BL-MT-08]
MTANLNNAVISDLRQLLMPMALTQCEGRSIVSFSGRHRIGIGDDGAARSLAVNLDEQGLHALATAAHWARGLSDSHADFVGRFAALESACARKVGAAAIVHGALAGWQLQRALQMLGEHLDQAIELDDIATACRVSRAHFAKAFRRSMGVPPYRWRLELRLAIARRAVVDTSESLTRIAQSLGFQQMTHFSHAFVRATGMSPRQWRRTFQSTHRIGVAGAQADVLQIMQMDDGDDLFVHLELLHAPGDVIVDALRILLVATLREDRSFDDCAEVLVEALHLCSTQARLAGKPDSAGGGQLAEWQVELARQLLSTPSEDTSIALVAAACGTSPGYFSKAFRATVGMCPRRWQAHSRVDRAKSLLETSTRMMIDIAGDCGFTEQSHFNHTFTRLVGCNPGAWRMQHQQARAG